METNLPNTQQTNSEHSIKDAANKTTNENNGFPEGKTLKSQDTQKACDLSDTEVTELLGSVTTPGTRFSARVIQKMKQDQTRPATPPPNDREQKKEEKNLQKTPSNIRANKPIWTNLERNHFFDALCEYGKDFEAVGNYINLKLKRKNATDKTTQQVRQHYYQTYHKICKYVKFSDEVKKPVQELYALINYGEMRRKLQFITDKHFMKLKHLVYQGHITVRCKGKNIRVKTPSCKALRRINQLDDALEDIRLPSKIEVLLTPANMETFGRLQTLAQNPRVRCMVPLHRKLVNFIKTFQFKWRSPEARLAEEEAKLFHADLPNEKREEKPDINHPIPYDTKICFLPKTGVTIHRPLVSITEHLSSVNICLNVYEDRLGVTVRSETLCYDRNNAKRQRTDSGSEKRSPDTKKLKQLSDQKPSNNNAVTETETLENNAKEHPNVQLKSESSSDELNEEIATELLLLTDNQIQKDDNTVASNAVNGNNLVQPTQQQIRGKRASIAKTLRGNHAASTTFKPLLTAEALRRIRQGWTMSNAADITIGDLYIVMGQDSRLELEYYWTDQPINEKTTAPNAIETNISAPTPSNAIASKSTDTSASSSLFMQKQTGMPYNPTDCDDPELLKSISSSSISNKLKHLLLIANLSERIRKRQCSCGHICERGNAKTRFERDFVAKSNIYGRYPMLGNQDNKSNNGRPTDSSVFRQPYLPPRRPLHSMDPVRQLAALSGLKTARQVLVQRLLLPGGASQAVEMDSEKFRLLEMPPQNSKTNKPVSTITEDPGENASVTTAPKSVEKPLVCSFAGTVNALKTQTSESEESLDSVALSENPSTTRNASSSNDSAIDDCSNITSLFGGMSPMHLLRETTSNSRWLEENLNDFSLTSLLGHLDEINSSNRDAVDPSNLSVISESSVDFMHKFQEISAFMQKQEKD